MSDVATKDLADDLSNLSREELREALVLARKEMLRHHQHDTDTINRMSSDLALARANEDHAVRCIKNLLEIAGFDTEELTQSLRDDVQVDIDEQIDNLRTEMTDLIESELDNLTISR